MPSYAQGLDMAHSLLLGGKGAAYDIEHARCILSFGSGLYEGWGAFGRMYRARLDWSQLPEDERPEIIQVDANLSVTANRASRWVPIRPGTEGALALGIAHVLIRDELYDKSFVDNHCFGFRDDEGGKSHHGFASEVLARYSPESVEKITQAPAREIEELARYFASHRPALALGGGGRGDRFSNLYALMSVHSLNALVGNINRRGGVFNQPLPPVKAPASARKDETARRGLSVARCDGAGGADYPLSDSLPHNIDARQVEILFVHEANPYYSLPDRQARELFENVPFIVSFSSYMDESAAQADLILPLSTPFERWDDTLGASGTPYPIYTLSRPLTDPLYDTRSAGDIAIELARRLGGSVAESFPWAAAAEVLKQNARDLYDANRGMVNTVKEAEGDGAKKLQERYPSFADFWGSLIENGCWYDPALEAGEALPTRSGKFEFYSQALREKFGFSNELKCMPHYSEPEPSPEGFDLLVMPEDLITMAGDGLGAPPLLIKQLSDNVLLKDELFVRVNPVTAMLQRLKDGDLVILESTRGKAKVRAHVSSGVREGVVVLPLGFGHTAYDEFLRDKGVNGCQLIEARKDPVSGLLCCCGTPAKLRKA
jgi:anaerobic selenocysteine-containing dehydrogenase